MANRRSEPRNVIEQFESLSNRGRHKDAAKILMKAADAGNPLAYNNLGICYDVGEGVRRNRKMALYYYKLAWAHDPDTGTLINIATLYRSLGKRSRARHWLRKAVELGDGDAALELAEWLYNDSTSLSGNQKAEIRRLLDSAVRSSHISEGGREEAIAHLELLSRDPATYVLPYSESRRLHDRAYRAQRKDQGEVCGLVFANRRNVLKLCFLRNYATEPGRFLRRLNEARELVRLTARRGWRPFGGFHSHPISEPIPSEGDIQGAFYYRHELIYDVCGRRARLWTRIKRNGQVRILEESLIVQR